MAGIFFTRVEMVRNLSIYSHFFIEFMRNIVMKRYLNTYRSNWQNRRRAIMYAWVDIP